MIELYSDRVQGGQPRDRLELPEHTSRALVGLVRQKISTGWFAAQFPVQCEDGRGVFSTNEYLLMQALDGVVPGVLDQNGDPTDTDVFDLLEYVATLLNEPSNSDYHDFYRHWHLRFTNADASKRFAGEVNLLLQRGRVGYDMTSAGRIVRLGTPELREVVALLQPQSGDPTLDAYILEARAKYDSRHSQDRAFGLERLWDAFERIKTIEPGANKKAQVQALLARFDPEGLRNELDLEMSALTRIGNAFEIRHKETNSVPVPEHASDYLFQRLAGLLIYLLRHTNRLA